MCGEPGTSAACLEIERCVLADDHITELINLPLTRGPRAGPERALEPCATVTTKLNYGTKLEARLDSKLISNPRT